MEGLDTERLICYCVSWPPILQRSVSTVRNAWQASLLPPRLIIKTSKNRELFTRSKRKGIKICRQMYHLRKQKGRPCNFCTKVIIEDRRSCKLCGKRTIWVMKIFFGQVFHLTEGSVDINRPRAERFQQRQYFWG